MSRQQMIGARPGTVFVIEPTRLFEFERYGQSIRELDSHRFQDLGLLGADSHNLVKEMPTLCRTSRKAANRSLIVKG